MPLTLFDVLAAPTMRDSLSAEYRFLVDVVTPGVSPSTDTIDPDRFRWDHLLDLAYWHRLAPVLFEYLGTDGPAPANVVAALEYGYIRNGARNLFIGATVERIDTALAAAGVPVMLLKGAALVDAVYSDPALREMGDIDVLVPKDKLDDANAALEEIGYGRKREIARDRDTKEWMRAHHRHDPPLLDPQRYVAVELHHHIVKGEPGAHFDIDDFWQRSRPSASGSHLLPSGEDLLLHACLHFTYHRHGPSAGALGQLCDIALIVDREKPDWEALVGSARAYRLESVVFLALFSAYELGLPVPAESLEALRPPGFNERVGRRMLALRVLRTEMGVPRRSMREALAPDRQGLEKNWGATTRGRASLLGAYLRRLVRSLPHVRRAAGQPLTVIRDYRLTRQLNSLTGHLKQPE